MPSTLQMFADLVLALNLRKDKLRDSLDVKG